MMKVPRPVKLAPPSPGHFVSPQGNFMRANPDADKVIEFGSDSQGPDRNVVRPNRKAKTLQNVAYKKSHLGYRKLRDA